MRKSCKSARKVTKTVTFNGMTWGERELSQLIRRKMITRGPDSKKKYQRQPKHRNNGIDSQ